MMDVTVWGSRGSIPVSGAPFHRHGGATTSLEVALYGAEGKTPKRILIDCGTGLTELGKSWGERSPEALILQTHFHWDHIQGFPFFRPLFNPKGIFELWATPRDGVFFQQVLSQQMSRPAFPVGLDILPSQLTFRDLPEEGEEQIGACKLRWVEQSHPSGSTAFCVEYAGNKMVFTGDVELRADQKRRLKLRDMAKNADLLVIDSQYTEEEYSQRKGWGHSTPHDGVDLALEAGVKHLLLTHHDPSHHDEKLDEKLAAARAYAKGRVLIDNAHDRLTLSLPSHRESLACA